MGPYMGVVITNKGKKRMHAVVMDSLEDYLSGAVEPADQRKIEAHLLACSTCREEVRSMQEVSLLFGSLRMDEAAAPSPAFTASVMQHVAGLKPAPTFAGLFALDFAFGRRLVFASLVLLAVLGSVIATREAQFSAGPSPDAILAQQESPAFDSAAAQDNMLVTLTAYEQH
jgi:anti-sigma factor RsiW